MNGLFALRPSTSRRAHSRGFTLIELMITLLVLGIVVVTITAVLYSASHNKVAVANRLESTQAARVALDMIARDIRNAGYGADLNDPVLPQTPLAYVDSLQILINANLYGDQGTKDTLAINPTGNPLPYPLRNTPWQPPSKYKTGAEVIRWTLDLNNDGQVDADDQNDPAAIDAQRSLNPNDYELVREVYGDSTGDVAGNNGGDQERIALVRRPGGGTPPMFSVYMKNSATPYDWSNGPVPPSQLPDIERVVVKVVAPSSKADSKGQYSQTTLETNVNARRNIPNFGAAEYSIYGYVYNDNSPKNRQRDGTEVGLQGATVRLNNLTTTTDMSGYYLFRAPAGTYTLKHTPPSGFGSNMVPDSFVVTVGPAVTRSFGDTVNAGGWVTAMVYNDLDGNGVKGAGETVRPEVNVLLNPGLQSAYTDTAGQVRLFAHTGAYTVTVTPPDSYAVTTTNPLGGTMTNGGSASISFGVQKNGNATVRGTVFRDNNRNGVVDAGETGIANVWVGLTPDGGVTVHGFTYTDASGNYSITAPINDPPHTTPDYAMVIPPAGFYPTNSTSIGPIWLQSGQLVTNQNFGMGTFQVITLNASRVLSLASADLVEKDWAGALTQNAVKDADLVLGADAGGTDNISVWFNQYNASPLFSLDPTYTRLAPQSVMSMVLDTLDSNAPKNRPDLVTGTKLTAAGNFFVWYNQGSSGNEGYFPATYSPSQNYRTLDNGDVQAMLAFDCAGGVGPDQLDLIIGTKSPTAGQGTLEIWQSNNAATPTFSRVETYPNAGAIPGNSLGEVTCMGMGDFDLDGRKDLVVGTKTGTYSGQLMFFRNVSKVTGARFIYSGSYSIANEAITSLTVTDVDSDGYPDVVIGTQSSTSSGRLQLWHNNNTNIGNGTVDFSMTRQIDAPGIVLSVINGDYGGSNRADIAIGYRTDNSSYAGGVRVYFTDSGTLPPNGVDPSAGAVLNMVPALNANNFNYGVYPSAPAAPYLTDLAAGVKTGALTGALVVFIR